MVLYTVCTVCTMNYTTILQIAYIYDNYYSTAYSLWVSSVHEQCCHGLQLGGWLVVGDDSEFHYWQQELECVLDMRTAMRCLPREWREEIVWDHRKCIALSLD